ncbi:MAG: thioredoxin domain-containing protein [Candidatus Woesearchaeota archaeon]
MTTPIILDEEHANEERFLTKSERKKLKKQEHQQMRRDAHKVSSRKRILSYVVSGIIALIVVAGIIYIGTLFSKFKAPTAEGEPMLGSPDAVLTIIEFGDYQCPYTKQFNLDIAPRLLAAYNGTVRIVFKDMITGKHINSDISAEAAECADDQGKYDAYQQILFSRQGTATFITLKRYAAEIGLDTARFDECLDSRKYKSEVKDDTAEGRGAQVGETPTLFIDGAKMNGIFTFNEYKAVIDQALARKLSQKNN